MSEPFWKEDVEKEIEYLGEGMRTLTFFYYSGKHHNAPQQVLTELANAYSDLANASQRLQFVTQFIKEEPK